MGTYLNPGNGLFQIALNSQIFVDKSNLIEERKGVRHQPNGNL